MKREDSPHPAAATLVLVRHGESEGNARNIYTGRLDLPLTARGRRQAIRVAVRLIRAGIRPNIVFSSCQVRAVETAELIISAFGWPIELVSDAALNERDYGILTGLRKDAPVPGIDPAQIKRWRRSYAEGPPQGESILDTEKRVVRYYKEAVSPKLTSSHCVLLVAHGNSLRALISSIEHLSPAEIEDLEIAAGMIVAYAISPEGDARHIAGLSYNRAPGGFTL